MEMSIPKSHNFNPLFTSDNNLHTVQASDARKKGSAN